MSEYCKACGSHCDDYHDPDWGCIVCDPTLIRVNEDLTSKPLASQVAYLRHLLAYVREDYERRAHGEHRLILRTEPDGDESGIYDYDLPTPDVYLVSDRLNDDPRPYYPHLAFEDDSEAAFFIACYTLLGGILDHLDQRVGAGPTPEECTCLAPLSSADTMPHCPIHGQEGAS